MFLFGFIGYLVRKFDLNAAAIVLGLILGPIGENGLRRSLYLSDGDPSILFSTPLLLAAYSSLRSRYAFSMAHGQVGKARRAQSQQISNGLHTVKAE